MTDTASKPLSRRTLIRTLGASTCVVGFNAGASSWVTAAAAGTDARFCNLPSLQGTLHLDRTTRTAYAQDFGDIVHEYPLAVLKPGSVHDVRRMLAFAQQHGIRVVGRGRGHTVFGQSQLRAGIVIDISTLQTIHHITEDRAVVDAGMRWNTLLAATLQRGLMPPALTDYIGQTVGGTLSVGGVGGMIHRHGAQVDNVLELQVLTGRGDLITCSETRRRLLFDAVLAGQGQVGIIVRATLRLVRAPARIRVFNLLYTHLAAMTADMQRLMEDQRFDYLEGASGRQVDGTWIYLLQAGSYYTAPAMPDQTTLLHGLADLRNFMAIDDQTFSAFANRVPEFPQQPHPWIDLILPYPAVESFVGQVEQVLKPLVEGDSVSVLLIPMRTDRFSRPLFRAPKTRHAIGFGILRFMPNDKAAVEQALQFNRSLFDQCLDVGGTHYPISAVRLGRDQWVRHYGTQFGRLLAAKLRYDPGNVLAGGAQLF